MEEKEAVVVDTSFLSSLFKIGRLNLIFRAFNIKEKDHYDFSKEAEDLLLKD